MKRRNFVKQSIAGAIIAATPLALTGLVAAAGGGPPTTTLPNTTQPDTTQTTQVEQYCHEENMEDTNIRLLIDSTEVCIDVIKCKGQSGSVDKYYKHNNQNISHVVCSSLPDNCNNVPLVPFEQFIGIPCSPFPAE
jgi:hypothetical protein